MARIVLITGGSRGGKSVYAQRLAEGMPGRQLFVATCPPLDGEMRERIRRHREERSERGWETVEEETDLEGVLRGYSEFDVVLVDCLTLWVNNLMYRAGQEGREVGEAEVERLTRALMDVAAERPGAAIFVTNEVGMGIVPENALARRYRDLVGRCNQVAAERADRVMLMVSGIPMEVK